MIGTVIVSGHTRRHTGRLTPPSMLVANGNGVKNDGTWPRRLSPQPGVSRVVRLILDV